MVVVLGMMVGLAWDWGGDSNFMIENAALHDFGIFFQWGKLIIKNSKVVQQMRLL